ncbi:MAG TPA: EAL domain-containing protein [Mycobacteriales bacterium]|nr:EAL domain-containing protein [Mycobacteriales bacterium]
MGLPDVLGATALRAAYQPVVSLETGQVLGFEALARGRCAPDLLLRQAREDGCIAELDWACRAAALAGALDAGLGSTLTLLVNVEPDTAVAVPAGLCELVARAETDLRVVLEITERAVVQRPSELMRVVDWARARNWGIALDDVGQDPASLALMPFLEPDVVKLDLRLVQERPTPEIGRVMSAVTAQAERTGAVVLAEGIEDDEDRQAALALGATVGQGWLLGRPEPLPSSMTQPDDVLPLRRTWAVHDDPTPFSVLRAARPLRRGDKSLLLGIAGHLEEQALSLAEVPVVLSTFEAGEPVPKAMQDRYSELTGRGSFVAALRTGDAPEVHDGTRGARLPDDHRLADEWSVVVVGAHYAGALVARRAADGDAYDFAVTHDRTLVVEAGRALLRHVAELEHPDRA